MSAGLIAGAIAIAGATLGADVKTDEKSTFKIEGVMGKMVGVFSKTARNGSTATVAVKANRKLTLTEDRGELIDLGEDKVYTLDLKHKTYTVATFEELRQRMQEARQRAESDAQKARAKGQEPSASTKGGRQPQLEIEVDVKDTGQKKNLNGFDTREVIMTVTAHEKGKTIEQAGGLMLTSSMWLAPAAPALKEIAEFDRRYARKLASAMLGGGSPQDAAAASAMHPMLKDVTVRMNSEQAKLSGVPIQTTTTVDSVQSPEVAAEQQKPSDTRQASGVGGLVGGLAGRIARKKDAAPTEAKGRARFMTMTHEVLKVATSVTAADVAIPEGFREK
jgi:hypothetical protein